MFELSLCDDCKWEVDGICICPSSNRVFLPMEPITECESFEQKQMWQKDN